MKQRLYANPIVGRTGLGNMLFPWARAEVFCKQTGAKMLAPQWVNLFRIGPWIRFERDKRYYFASFTNRGYIGGLRRQVLLRLAGHCSESEAARREGTAAPWPGRIVDFAGMEGYFSSFLGNQPFIKERLLAITSPAIRTVLEQAGGDPFLGVHIRRGDFQQGGYVIDDAWYVRAIERALSDLGAQGHGIGIRVFSDAHPDALHFICRAFSKVTVMPCAPALQDLLCLSQAQAVVGTNRSTFSMWAVFLGQMPSYWCSTEIPPALSLPQSATVVVE